MNRRQLLQLGGAVGPAMLLSRSVQAADAELVVGSNVGAPPFAFKQGDTYSGFDVEVWDEVAKGLNRTWRLQPMEFGALIPALQTHNIDVIVSQLFIKPERRQVIDFSDPYYKSGLIALTRIDNTTIYSAGDLASKHLGTETGTVAVGYIKEHIKDATLEQLPSINNALLALEGNTRRNHQPREPREDELAASSHKLFSSPTDHRIF
ncbi:MAG: transporter substrate-binding domain-containing protein [Paraburkholderia graminis]|jgi:glutamine transport system substrate-binding protein